MSDYPALAHLLGAYLHQDFLDEFPSSLDAVRVFVITEPIELVRSADDEITNLLQDERFQDGLGLILRALGSFYDPDSEGVSPADWLEQVRVILRSR